MYELFDQSTHDLVNIMINYEVNTYKKPKNDSNDNEPFLSFSEKITDGFF